MNHRSSLLARRASRRDLSVLLLGLVLVAAGVLLSTCGPPGGLIGTWRGADVVPTGLASHPQAEETERRGGPR